MRTTTTRYVTSSSLFERLLTPKKYFFTAKVGVDIRRQRLRLPVTCQVDCRLPSSSHTHMHRHTHACKAKVASHMLHACCAFYVFELWLHLWLTSYPSRLFRSMQLDFGRSVAGGYYPKREETLKTLQLFKREHLVAYLHTQLSVRLGMRVRLFVWESEWGLD